MWFIFAGVNLSVSGLCKVKQTDQLGGDDSLNDNRRFLGNKKGKMSKKND